MSDHFDLLETRDPQAREEALLAALPAQLQHACQHSAACAEILAGVDLASIRSRAALAQLPVTRKSDLLARQQRLREQDVFGGFAAIGWRGMGGGAGPALRVFSSPGPIYEPEGRRPDYWRLARALHAAGFRAGDLVHNSFSYHMTPAGSMMETGAHALGCTVFPGGVGNTEQQLQAIRELRPHGYAGTPSFLRILLDKAAELGLTLPGLTRALVSGEAFPASLRGWLAERGIAGMQCYATADLGLVAYETAAREGMVLDEHLLLEIVRPGTGDPLPVGEVGEVVVTTFNPDYPLVRFGTGDLSAVLPGPCPTGRTNVRIKGWMGRADQTTKVRGLFVHPSQVAEVTRRHPQVLRARLIVTGALAKDELTLRVETASPSDGLALALTDSVRDITRLRAQVAFVAPGDLPNDGKVIEDARSHD